MKTNSVLKIMVVALLGITLIFSGCERLPTSVTNKNKGTKAVQRKDLGTIGIFVNEQTGVVRIYQKGKQIGTGKFDPNRKVEQNVKIVADESEKTSIEPDVSFVPNSFRYTPEGCDGGGFIGGDNLRTFTIDIVLNSGGPHTFLVPGITNTNNLSGVGASLRTDFVNSDVFTIAFDLALTTCDNWSFFLSLTTDF